MGGLGSEQQVDAVVPLGGVRRPTARCGLRVSEEESLQIGAAGGS